MSQAPHVVRGARWGLRLGPAVPFEDSLWEALTDTYCGFSMAQTAENLAEEYDISRDDVDRYALRSQQLAKAAWDEGRFDEGYEAIRFLFMGNLLLEAFFGIPGLGRLTVEAINNNDFPTISAMVYISALLYIGGNLLTDISYTFVDPRVRMK